MNKSYKELSSKLVHEACQKSIEGLKSKLQEEKIEFLMNFKKSQQRWFGNRQLRDKSIEDLETIFESSNLSRKWGIDMFDGTCYDVMISSYEERIENRKRLSRLATARSPGHHMFVTSEDFSMISDYFDL